MLNSAGSPSISDIVDNCRQILVKTKSEDAVIEYLSEMASFDHSSPDACDQWAVDFYNDYEDEIEVFVGRIMWFSEREGHGVLKSEEDHEFYFDESVTKIEPSELKRGDRAMIFRINTKVSDTLCAKDVRRLNG